MLGEDHPRSPLARCKALHAGLNGGIDEVFLDSARWIILSGDEGEYGVHPSQNLGQLCWVVVVCFHPCEAWGGLSRGSIL